MNGGAFVLHPKKSDTVQFMEKLDLESSFKHIQRLRISNEIWQRVSDRWTSDSEGASFKLGFHYWNNQVMVRWSCGSQFVATLDDGLFDAETGNV